MTFTKTEAVPAPTKKSPPTELPEVDARSQCGQDALVDQIIEAISDAGVCIVRNIFSPEIVSQILEDLEPYVAKTTQFDSYNANGCQMTGLLTKSETYAHKVVGNYLFQKVHNYFITARYRCWVQEGVQMTFESPPQLNSTVCFYLNPDSPDQLLHRDDQIHQHWNGAASEYVLGRDAVCSMFAALTPATRDNGTTRFIPGSHLWDYKEPYPVGQDPRLRYAELNPGDCFMMLGSVVHASSANTTTDQRRVLISTHVSRSNLRAEENHFLTYSLEEVKKFPLWLQQFIGYTVSKPFCGWVDKKDPLRLVNPKASDALVSGYGKEYLEAKGAL